MIISTMKRLCNVGKGLNSSPNFRSSPLCTVISHLVSTSSYISIFIRFPSDTMNQWFRLDINPKSQTLNPEPLNSEPLVVVKQFCFVSLCLYGNFSSLFGLESIHLNKLEALVSIQSAQSATYARNQLPA